MNLRTGHGAMDKIKFAVISDVHSNIQALQAVLDDINAMP